MVVNSIAHTTTTKGLHIQASLLTRGGTHWVLKCPTTNWIPSALLPPSFTETGITL